jgi:predicted outer membrane repeat protein
MKNGVTIYGGFAGTEPETFDINDRDLINNETILSGDLLGNDNVHTIPSKMQSDNTRYDNSEIVVIASQVDSNTVIDGFTIKSGHGGGLGAGMLNVDSNTKIINCTYTRNFTEWGAGIGNENSNPTIINCNFESNGAMGGGGIVNADSNPTIINCIFNNNFGQWNGGAVINGYAGHNAPSNPDIVDCSFTNNKTNGDGGAIYNNINSDINITECNFINNHANRGGGIFNRTSNPTVTNCDFINNVADLYGGGYSNSYSSNSILINCTFIDNSADSLGGGIDIESGEPILDGCTFRKNTARNGGGIFCEDSNAIITNCIISDNVSNICAGIDCSGQDSPTITNSTITGNYAYSFGAGICNFRNPITNCIIAGNSTPGDGGGLFECSSPIINCTIIGNSAGYGGGTVYCSGQITNSIIWNNRPEQVSYWHDEVTYSNIQNGWSGLGNINIDPCFVDPGYWDANGTPDDMNDDYFVTGDYHLKSQGWRWDFERHRWDWDNVTSRCIDAGNPGSPLADELLSIPDDQNNQWGINKRINMGVYGGTAEASMAPYDWALLSDVDNSGKIDYIDLNYLCQIWLSTDIEQYADFNRDGIIDNKDLALLASDWLDETSWH